MDFIAIAGSEMAKRGDDELKTLFSNARLDGQEEAQ